MRISLNKEAQPSSKNINQHLNLNLNLNKIFKNLIVTKRHIMDIQKSISKITQSMDRIDRYLESDKSTQRRKKRCQSLFNKTIKTQTKIKIKNKINSISNHQTPRKIIFKCPKISCQKQFSEKNRLIQHIKQNHRFCRLCQKYYQENKQDHKRTYCSQERVVCLGCSAKIKRKNIEEHIENCCYKMCFKCKEAIYAKAYQYHLQHCSRSRNNWINECKKLPSTINNRDTRENSLNTNISTAKTERTLLSSSSISVSIKMLSTIRQA